MSPACVTPMRRLGQRLPLVVCSLALALMGTGCRAPRPPLTDEPVAVVLLQTARGSELVVVDLEHFEIARRVRLRSLALSIDGDVSARAVVTAQCGGPGPAADSAVGVCYPDRSDRVHYVDLAAPNPVSVAVGDGRAFVVHGFEQEAGLVTSWVSPAELRSRPGPHLQPTAGRPSRVGEHTLVPLGPAFEVSGETSASAGALARASSGSVRTVAALPFEPSAVFGTDDAGGEVLCVGSRDATQSDRRWELARIDVHSGEILTQADIPGVAKAVFEACVWGEEVVLADADGLDLNDPGDCMLVLDARTLRVRRAIEIDGMPAALGLWGARLLVVDGINGRLLLFEPGGSTPERVLELGGSPGGTADLVVFGESERAGR